MVVGAAARIKQLLKVRNPSVAGWCQPDRKAAVTIFDHGRSDMFFVTIGHRKGR